MRSFFCCVLYTRVNNTIYGVNCYGGAYNTVDTHLEKIKKWAEKREADVKVVRRPLAHKILFEITDPVAAYIEKHKNCIG